MAPLTPIWIQPSHPDVQKVLTGGNTSTEFLTKSISTVNLAPYALFAKLDFPPCTKAEKPTYATVQMGKEEHLNLNSDLVYINHSCEPSVIFDTSSLSILAGPNGLKEGQELTFFYPSTEWDMAQGFDCFCNTPTCRGFISGAKNMTPKQLEGLWLNVHIRSLLEKHNKTTNPDTTTKANGHSAKTNGITNGYGNNTEKSANGTKNALYGNEQQNGDESEVGKRRGVTSREMSGEMGGDTSV